MNKEDLILRALQVLLTDQDGTEIYNEIEDVLNPKESNTEQKIKESLDRKSKAFKRGKKALNRLRSRN